MIEIYGAVFIRTTINEEKKIIGIITCATVFLAASSIPTFGADGWQQDCGGFCTGSWSICILLF